MDLELLTHPTPFSVRSRFHQLVTEWKQQSRFLSSATQMAMLRPYQRIIGIGPNAVPLILEELKRETDFWFWALETITDENPVSPDDSGFVAKMTDAWLAWGRQRGLIS